MRIRGAEWEKAYTYLMGFRRSFTNLMRVFERVSHIITIQTRILWAAAESHATHFSQIGAARILRSAEETAQTSKSETAIIVLRPRTQRDWQKIFAELDTCVLWSAVRHWPKKPQVLAQASLPLSSLLPSPAAVRESAEIARRFSFCGRKRGYQLKI